VEQGLGGGGEVAKKSIEKAPGPASVPKKKKGRSALRVNTEW
jgi:hypothetical protein